jgi:hypothetical protein
MNEYRDTFSSVLKFCNDFAAEMKGRGWDMKVVNFDAANDPQTWPSSDVVGVSEFDFELDDGTIGVSMMLVISTVEDTNNFRLTEIMNQMVNKTIPGKRMSLVDGASGRTRGFLVVQNGTRVAPPLDLETRTAQGIMVNLLSDQTLRA